MTINCWICNQATVKKTVQLRSKKEATLHYCHVCDFEFFSHENDALLSNNQLDKTRLESAGLDIPKQEKDFENGYNQSKTYVSDYLNKEDVGAKILEIGCSWGYFLKAAKEFGAVPYGLEINPVRLEYVKEKLGINCKPSLEDYISSKTKFKKIFSFYCLEYIKHPLSFFNNLLNLLEPGGEIIFITPNLNDVLKDVWHNPGYQHFFYDECAIGYYSFKAINSLLNHLKKDRTIHTSVQTKQGYSLYNHLHWYFNQKPINNNCLVGGDRLPEDIKMVLEQDKSFIGDYLANLIYRFDQEYKKVIEENNFGNQILIRIKKQCPV
ncbi:MAG: class I SAM-dependent methyltransferase [Proteobacteria bacterium]|nr:class I SAM-dependent methyltransferase [Pseudomonadota bacterium]